MTFDIHIIGGGLAGSEAAWQLAEAGLARAPQRNARRRRHRRRRTRPTASPKWSARTASAPTMPSTMRSACSTRKCATLGSLIMRAADQHRVPAGSALAVDREAFAAEVTRAHRPRIPISTIVRERVDALPDHPTIVATGPLTGSGARRSDRRRDRRGRPRLLRRHRPDRPPRQHRHGRLLDGRALGQGRQGLHQLPDGQGAI